MDQDMIDEDGAINLSTSQRPSAATTPNDSVHQDDVEQVSGIFFESGHKSKVWEKFNPVYNRTKSKGIQSSPPFYIWRHLAKTLSIKMKNPVH